MEEFINSDKGRVTIYSIEGCPQCRQAKAILAGLGVPVCDVDLNEHPKLQAPVKKLTGRIAVPQIFFNNLFIGGNEKLQKMAPEELQKLVKMVKEEPLTADALPLPERKPSQGAAMDTDCGEKLIVCEKDGLADLVAELKDANLIGTQRMGLSLYKKSFSKDQLLAWLQNDKGMDQGQALGVGQGLLLKKYMVIARDRGESDSRFGAASRDTLYRLMEDDPHSALNAGQTASCIPVEAAEISLRLRELILKLFSEHLSADGKSVDYKGMSANPVFRHYSELAIQLQRVKLHSLSREETLAFFINIYNALVIHGYLRMGTPTNKWQRYRFFNYVSYLIGGEVFTLQDIENGVLRGNRKGLAQLRRPFSKTDPRLQVALKDVEPLIHFALNCGAKSCPPIKTYTPQDIDCQLRTAAEAFLENDDACVVDSGKKEVRLSQIFKWYKVDFGGTDEKLLNWVLKHMSDSPKKTSLKGVLSAGKTKVSFLPYDWSSNSSH
ncbi:uncharacterized protein zgc:152951 [Phycodurus eques]|uniref:uncharacterized protein zgc:152951 n=1 Tax=Phycodurus eques TaxID=693459 RepID=UPI002ACE669D|nr:uncharacterized protein zgc:152951 [Phycodurus eques]XP_061547658.1 uncharacterized protein zgc:152951 [Phycodurus eques]XP_061547659.1 uncharacterized protein zgc:152951 [Phycodurus eques]